MYTQYSLTSRHWLWVLALLAALLTGCAGSDHTNQERMAINIRAGKSLNIDYKRQPLSVVVRFYQLTSLEQFMTADMDQLWSAPEQTLSNTLLGVHELTLLPNMNLIEEWNGSSKAKFIGVAAFFRESRNSHWKVAFDSKKLHKSLVSPAQVRLLLNENRIKIEKGTDRLNDSELRPLRDLISSNDRSLNLSQRDIPALNTESATSGRK